MAASDQAGSAPRRGRTAAAWAVGIGLLVLGVAAHASRDRLQQCLAKWLNGETWFHPEPGLAGQAVDIPPGDIEVNEFLRLLADHTGRQVVLDAGLRHVLRNTIHIVTAIKGVDADVIAQILHANGFVVRSRVAGGRTLRVEVGFIPGQEGCIPALPETFALEPDRGPAGARR